MEVELVSPRPAETLSPVRPSWRTLAGVGCTLLVVLAIWLRFWNLSAQSLWHDELYTLANVNGLDLYLFDGSDIAGHETPRLSSDFVQLMRKNGFGETWFRNIVHEGHPPLYGLLLKVWTLIFGDTEIGLRSFSVSASVLTMIPLYLAAKRLGGALAGVLTVAMFAAAPFHVYFAQEARSYALTILLCAVTGWAAVEIAVDPQSPRKRLWWLIWCVGATASLYSHFYAAIYCLLLIPVLWHRRRPNESRWKLAAVLCLPFMLLALWIPVLRLQMKAQSVHWTDGSTGPWEAVIGFVSTLKEMLSGVGTESLIEVAIGGVLLLIAIAAGLFSRDTRVRKVIAYGMGLLLGHAVVVYALDLALDHHMIMVPRFSVGLAVVIPVLLGIGLSRLGAKGAAIGFVYVCVGVFACMETSTGRRAPKQMFYQVAGFLNANVKAGEPVFITPSGPSLLGVARLVHPGMVLAACPADEARATAEAAARQCGTAWIVEQRLGIDIEAWKLDVGVQTPPKGVVTHFAGMDVRRVTAE